MTYVLHSTQHTPCINIYINDNKIFHVLFKKSAHTNTSTDIIRVSWDDGRSESDFPNDDLGESISPRASAIGENTINGISKQITRSIKIEPIPARMNVGYMVFRFRLLYD